MKSKLKIVILLLMLGLLPVRALAAVTTGFCAFAHHHHGAAASAEHSQASHQHNHDSPAHRHGETSCSSCVEHCSSAAFAPSESAPKLAQAFAGEHSFLYQRSVAGFIADPLDPPPLAA